MLADYLVYQENEMMTQERRSSSDEDIVQHFPTLEAALSEEEKQAVRDWVRNKMAQVSLRALSSRTDSKQKTDGKEALPPAASYKSQVEMVLAMNEKERQINTLRESLARLQEHILHKDNEIRMVRQQLSGASKEHTEELRNMVRANAAGERSICLFRDRIAVFDNTVKAMNLRISKYFGEDEQVSKYNLDNVRISVLDQNVKKMMERILELEDTLSWKQDQWKDDRRSVLKSIQVLDRGQSVADSLQDYVRQTRAGLDGILQELAYLGTTVGVQFPEVSGGSRNGNNNRLYRMPSEGEYCEINERLKELKEKVDDLVEENRTLRQDFRPSSGGLNLFLRRNEQQLQTSTDSESSDIRSVNSNLYSGKYFRKQQPQNGLTPISSPSSSKKCPSRSPGTDKKLNGDTMLLPDIGSSCGSLNRFLSPKPKDEKKNHVNVRQMELNSPKRK